MPGASGIEIRPSFLLPILVTIPHGSSAVPEEIFARMRAGGEPEADLRRRLLSEGDPGTDLLYDFPVTAVLRAPASRFVVDLNRARGEGGPNGVIKSTDFQLRPLYAPDYFIDAEERERRLLEYYDPFHREVAAKLASGHIRFLLDGHSMTAQGPMLGPDPGQPRPALCLGNFGDAEGNPLGSEPVSLDPTVARAVRKHASFLVGRAFPQWDPQRRALLNDPFDGGHIVRRYTHPNFPHRVPGLLFEINRALYLDETRLEPLPGAIETWRGLIFDLAEFLIREIG